MAERSERSGDAGKLANRQAINDSLGLHARGPLRVALRLRLLVLGLSLGPTLGAGALGRRVARDRADHLAGALLDLAERLLDLRRRLSADQAERRRTEPVAFDGLVDIVSDGVQ